MGSYFQTIVDVECLDESEAASLGRRVLERLIERGIVEPEPVDRPHVPENGHPPGPRFVEALAEPLAAQEERSVRSLHMNVVEVIPHRSVHHGGQGEVELICPRCEARQEPAPEWGAAVAEWHDDRGPGSLACEACGENTPVTEYRYDPPYGFSCLGIAFWNWPPLSDVFVEQIGELLGHRVLLVDGRA